MRLSAAEVSTFLQILERIDQGSATPEIPGRIGRFILQYTHARRDVDRLLVQAAARLRHDGALSGKLLGTADFSPLVPLHVSTLRRPLGDVADTCAVSEALGGVVRLRLWLKAGPANAVFNTLRTKGGATLSGDYRWTPPNRATPGESAHAALPDAVDWARARSIKIVADDMDRPPHALEYLPDYAVGPAGLKCFRSIAARRDGNTWYAIGAFSKDRPLRIECSLCTDSPSTTATSTLLVYREPWSSGWTIAREQCASESDLAAHLLSWMDFQKELDGDPLDARCLEAIRRYSTSPAELIQSLPPRQLLPTPRRLLRWLRGLD